MAATAVLQMRIDTGGGYGPIVTGGQIIPASATVQFSAASYAGWGSPPAVYEFPAGRYPKGWPCPAGWTDNNGSYQFVVSSQNGFYPPPVTFPDATDVLAGLWGTWLPRLIVNGTIIDETCGLTMLSPSGLKETAVAEGSQLGGADRLYLDGEQDNLRIIEAIAAGTGTGVTLGAGTPAAVSAAAGSQGALLTAAPFDHSHQVSTGTPVDIGTANSSGGATTLARSNHVHRLTFLTVAAVLATASTDIGFNGVVLTNVGAPSASNHVATKGYVDAALNGLDLKVEVRGASVGPQSLAGPLTEDGITYADGDRYLAKDQADPTENGIYIVDTAGSWTRAPDADDDTEVTPGLFCFVLEGTQNGNTGWALMITGPVVLGTTALTFTQIFAPNAVVAGNGLTQAGNTINVVANGDGSIVVNANDIQLNTSFTALLTGATSSPTANTLAKRGASGELAAVWFAPALTGMASSGLLRATGAAQTLIGALNGLATFSVVAIDASGGTLIGDTTAGSVTVQTQTAFRITDGSIEAFAVDYGNAELYAGFSSFVFTDTTAGVYLSHSTLAGSGLTAGLSWTIEAQQGQITSGATNNNGGNLVLKGGPVGTGGTGGTRGEVLAYGNKIWLRAKQNFIVDDEVNTYLNFAIPAKTFDLRANTLTITDDANPVSWKQTVLSGTGATAGQDWTIEAQPGQAQSGGNNNNSGGTLRLKGGPAGTGGSGSAGVRGSVVLYGGAATGTLSSTSWTVTVPVVATYYAATLTSIATVGLLRTTSASQTIIASQKNGGSADVSVLAIDGSDNLVVGDYTNGGDVTVRTATKFVVTDGAVAGLEVNEGTEQVILRGGTGTATLDAYGITANVPVIASSTTTLDATSLSFGATAGAITVNQAQRGSTGTNAGSALTVRAQKGQNVAAGTNNDGGDLVLAGGLPGTGGSNGNRGNVDLGDALAGHGGGKGVYGFATSYTAPTTSPIGGVVAYVSPEGGLYACAKGATSVPTNTTIAPPITDSGSVGVSRWDVLEDRVIKVTNNNTQITLWSYTPAAGELVEAIVTVHARRGTNTLARMRRLYIDTGAGAPSLTVDAMSTTDINNGVYTGGGTPVDFDYTGGDIRIRVTADNAVGTTWIARVHYMIFKP